MSSSSTDPEVPIKNIYCGNDQQQVSQLPTTLSDTINVHFEVSKLKPQYSLCLLGLLANLWEFPSLPSDYDGNSPAELELAEQKCRAFLNARQTRLTYVSDVFHQFSHISQTYAVHHCPAAECVDEDVVIPDNYQAFKWSNVSEIATSAISTAMKKVLRGFNENSRSGAVALKRKGKGDHHARDAGKNKKQMTLRSYFTT